MHVEGAIFKNCINLDIPKLSRQCKNGMYYGFSESMIMKENCVELMLGYDGMAVRRN